MFFCLKVLTVLGSQRWAKGLANGGGALFLARALSFVAIGESAFVLDCMSVSPQNSDVETLTTNVMRWHLERGVFGR